MRVKNKKGFTEYQGIKIMRCFYTKKIQYILFFMSCI